LDRVPTFSGQAIVSHVQHHLDINKHYFSSHSSIRKSGVNFE
jgi:hypothetical protein